jgi:uncharacterized damage-inducible protein DinB
MQNQHFVTLLEFNYWANRQVVEAALALTPEQLHAPTAISHGSAFDLIRHTLDVEWSWRLFASNLPAQKLLWEIEDLPDLPAIRAYWPGEYARQLEFVQSLSEADLDRRFDAGTAQGGSPRFIRVYQVLFHITHHAAQHRTELAHYLQSCGLPSPEVDFAAHVTELPGA